MSIITQKYYWGILTAKCSEDMVRKLYKFLFALKTSDSALNDPEFQSERNCVYGIEFHADKPLIGLQFTELKPLLRSLTSITDVKLLQLSVSCEITDALVALPLQQLYLKDCRNVAVLLSALQAPRIRYPEISLENIIWPAPDVWMPLACSLPVPRWRWFRSAKNMNLLSVETVRNSRAQIMDVVIDDFMPVEAQALSERMRMHVKFVLTADNAILRAIQRQHNIRIERAVVISLIMGTRRGRCWLPSELYEFIWTEFCM